MNDFTTLTCALCAGSIFAVYRNRTHVRVAFRSDSCIIPVTFQQKSHVTSQHCHLKK